MEPLAYKIRPKQFSDIVGQDHLVGPSGVITKMIEKKRLGSMILFGPPGTGKTSIANIIKDMYPLNSYTFNAASDSKQELKQIILESSHRAEAILVIDEIHRMKKDTQDFLLPYVERGIVTIIGLTTENPYVSVNHAVRSRCHIYSLKSIEKKDVLLLLNRTIKNESIFSGVVIPNDVLNYIVLCSGNEIRTALNMLEVCSLIDNKDMNISNIKNILGARAKSLDSKNINYYDILSAFIKSIRGSDPDAAIHYLSRLITIGDLDIIVRRLLISAYEDIGFGNPTALARVRDACDAAMYVGLPEAKYPLSFAVIDLATSPKSNSSYNAINEALKDYRDNPIQSIPSHILNREIKLNKNLYKYPHDYKNSYVEQEYMPKELKNKKYYIPKENSKYEKALSQYMKKLKE